MSVSSGLSAVSLQSLKSTANARWVAVSSDHEFIIVYIKRVETALSSNDSVG